MKKQFNLSEKEAELVRAEEEGMFGIAEQIKQEILEWRRKKMEKLTQNQNSKSK